MAPEQGPEFKNASCGKTSTPTNVLESGQEQSTFSQTASLQTDSLGWIYLLKKDKLVEVCRQNGITITDRVTVDQLRRQLTELIRLKRQRASSENLLRSLEEELINEERKPISEEPVNVKVPITNNPRTTKTQNNVNDTEVMATIRRWELTYDGGDNLMEFIERLEELAECYGLEQSRLLFALLEILRNRALQWYRIKREHIDTWEKFKEEATRFFLPKRHLAHLEESIYHRKQGIRERAKDYIMSLQALIRQHPELKKINHTDRIYDGLRYEYRLYIRRHDFSTLDELMDLAEEYEILRKEEAKLGKPQPNHYLDTTSYNRKTHCWRCRKIGHFRRQCPNRGQIFCSRCGQQGILSRICQCDKSPENADGRFYMDIRIFGKRVRALVDTGSTLTYIGNEIQTLLDSRKILPRNHQRTVQLADGTCVSSIKVYPITVLANGKPTRLLASAMRTLAEPVILGMDFLCRRNVTLAIDGVKLQASEVHNGSPSDANYSMSTREDLTSEQEEKLQGVLSQAKSSFEKIQGPCNVGAHVIRMKHNNLKKSAAPATAKKPAAKKAAPNKKIATKAKLKDKDDKKKAAAGKKPQSVLAKLSAKASASAKSKKPATKPGSKVQKGTSKAKAVALLKAKKSQTKVTNGIFGARTRKVRTNVYFRRPKTLKSPRNPKYPRKSVPTRNRMDAYNIIKYPLTTEAAMKKIEGNKTLAFLTHGRAKIVLDLGKCYLFLER